jgi:hypothetical protein
MSPARLQAASDDLGGKAILEEALVAIEGVAVVLLVIGSAYDMSLNTSELARAADYLADRLNEHREGAMDGYRRIFHLDQYNADRRRG